LVIGLESKKKGLFSFENNLRSVSYAGENYKIGEIGPKYDPTNPTKVSMVSFCRVCRLRREAI